MPKINVNGVNLHYQITGRGPTVIIIHGFTANSAFWYFTVVPLLAQDFRVITYDLRGHGRSDMPPNGYSSAEMALDLLGMMDQLEIGKAHVIGHSFGGEIGLQCAVHFPERVRSLTLAEGRVRALQPIRSLQNRPRWQIIRRKIEELGIEIPNGSEKGGRLFEELANQMWPNGWDDYIPGQQAFGPFGLGAWRRRSVERWIQLFCTTTANSDLATPAGLTPEKIQRVRQPVFAIYGDRSGFLATLRALRRLLPSCQTIIIPGAGHLLPVVAPRIFANNVRAFLSSVGQRNAVAN
jgi:pimeloyl-ACP methyl ester carboxylesterase